MSRSGGSSIAGPAGAGATVSGAGAGGPAGTPAGGMGAGGGGGGAGDVVAGATAPGGTGTCAFAVGAAPATASASAAPVRLILKSILIFIKQPDTPDGLPPSSGSAESGKLAAMTLERPLGKTGARVTP